MNNNSTTVADEQEPVLKDRMARPLRDLRVSLTDQCNLRCTYCMPAEIFDQEHAFLQKGQLIRLEELERLIGAFVRCGVRKIRLTGGEPLVRRGVVEFLGCLKKFPEIEDLAMT
ncbi:MAG: radical SAM protein, partial [Spartobacteria bacterium]